MTEYQIQCRRPIPGTQTVETWTLAAWSQGAHQAVVLGFTKEGADAICAGLNSEEGGWEVVEKDQVDDRQPGA